MSYIATYFKATYCNTGRSSIKGFFSTEKSVLAFVASYAKMKWHLFNRRNEAPCDYECGSSNYQFLIPSRTFSPLPTNSLHKNDLPQRHPSTPYYAEPCHPSNKVPPLPPIPGLENLFSILSSSPSPDSARPFR